MSSFTVSVPSRSPWRSLFWTVPATALWTGLIVWLPGLTQSGFPALAVRLMVQGLVALGLWLGLERSALTPDQRRTTWVAVMVPLTLWAALAWTAGIDGAFRLGASALPRLPMAIVLPVIVGAPLLLLAKRVGQALDATPATWLIAIQIYRIFGAQWLAGWLRGALPGVWALPAGVGDVLTGLFAVPAAMALATGAPDGRKAAILWNLFGVADLALAITLGLITSPGPFQLIVPDEPGIGAGDYPNVLTPAFVVPSSILLHLLSLRQLRRAAARTASGSSSVPNPTA
jgi:hypothetical protein